ncbi:MAG: LamG-like jellyroll fold domain-containing protein, partial [Planctomycetota bacterium]
HVAGDPLSRVGATLGPNGLEARIVQKYDDVWRIEPPRKGKSARTGEAAHLVKEQDEPSVDELGICGTCLGGPLFDDLQSKWESSAADTLKDEKQAGEVEGLTGQVSSDEASIEAAICQLHKAEISFDCDYFYFQDYGTVAATVARVQQMLNEVDLYYARDVLITYELVEVVVRETQFYPSPYADGTLLDQFRSEWVNNTPGIYQPHDLSHLMTERAWSGGIAGLAWVSTVCTSYAYGWSRDSAGIVGHEVGHNWAAGHCHDTSPCNNMCGACMYIAANTKKIIESFRDSRGCLDLVGAYTTPVPPYAMLDTAVILHNQDARFDVLGNDHEANCDPISLDDFQTVSNLGGTVVRSVGTGPEGRDELVYTPSSYEFGEDSFTYTAGDGTGMQSTGTVKVNVRLPNTMQGYWTLDETSGSTARDSSGNGFDGTLEGPFTFGTASITGKFGGALDFNGVNEHIETGKTAFDLGLMGNAARTITVWVYTRSFNDGGVYEMGRQSSGQDFSLRTESTDNWWRVQYWGSSYDIDFYYSSKYQWVHFAHVHDGTTTKIYADGQLLVNEARTLNTGENKTFRIGMWDDFHFDGLIDDVRVYNYALDLPEIYEVISGGWADNPRPFDTEEFVPQHALLNWVPGAAEVDHDVYFGTSLDAVANATTDSAEYKGRQGEAIYVPYMDTNTVYYWRIDEAPNVPPPPPPPPPPPMSSEGFLGSEQAAETASTANIITGKVWSFKTGRNMGTVTREVWTGIGGNLVSDLTSHSLYPDSPTIREEITRLEGPTNWANNYGTRFHGFLTPPVTGSYTFWIASDDYSELWLSSDTNPANASRRAHVPGWTDPRQWYDFPEQQSNPIFLTGGQTYYIKVLHKEGGGDDNIAVAWEGPGVVQQIISRLYISPYDTDLPKPNPMTWAKPPYPTSSTSISMEATAALDRSSVKYYFAWQDSSTYEDTDLEPNTVYGYAVTACDKSYNENSTGPSDSYLARTLLLADLENDNDVDFFDYSRFMLHWPGAGPAEDGSSNEADLDGDGDTDMEDLAILLDNWLETVEHPLPIPGQTSNPDPADGALGVSTTAKLSWTAGANATSYNVYFGTSSPGTFQGNQAATTYDPGAMAPSIKHYWRIDAVNKSGINTGVVWSFTTMATPPP